MVIFIYYFFLTITTPHVSIHMYTAVNRSTIWLKNNCFLIDMSSIILFLWYARLVYVGCTLYCAEGVRVQRFPMDWHPFVCAYYAWSVFISRLNSSRWNTVVIIIFNHKINRSCQNANKITCYSILRYQFPLYRSENYTNSNLCGIHSFVFTRFR